MMINQKREMSHVIRFCRVCALAVMILVCNGIFPCQAADAQHLVFGFGNSETPPFKSKEGGKYVGIFFDVIQEIVSRTEINIDVKPYPYDRLMLYLENGHIDGAVGVFKTPEREQFAEYLATPIAWTTMTIFVRKGNEFSFGKISDLSGKRIGKVRGISVSKEFDQAMQQGTFSVEETNTYEQSIKKLQTGRIEALVSPLLSTQFNLVRMRAEEEIVMLPHPVAPPRPLYILFSKAANTPEKEVMIGRIRQVVKDMGREKRFEQIMQKYGFHVQH
jgi:polar amino acid transport system substrate-binding protein